MKQEHRKGLQYNSLAPELIQQRQKTHELCRQFSRSPSKGNLKRIKQIFQKCGEKVIIEAGFYCDYGDKILVGNNVFININCTIIDGGEVHIGDDCLIGPNVQFLTVGHDQNPNLRLAKHNYAKDIVIGQNVWLGGGVIILGGVIVGDNVVVGAGSVVTKNIESNCLYAGNPAKKIRSL